VNEKSVQTFEDLECWKAARELKLFIVKIVIPMLPKHDYDLKDQLLRASRSTTANIAEGYGRFHYLDNAKFCSISRGSIWEVLDHLISAHDENLIPDDIFQEGKTHVHKTIRILNGYMKYLQSTAKKLKEPEAEYNTDQPTTDN